MIDQTSVVVAAVNDDSVGSGSERPAAEGDSRRPGRREGESMFRRRSCAERRPFGCEKDR